MEEPQHRYAEDGDLRLAYQVVGEGPLDLLFLTGGEVPIDLLWDHPSAARLFGRLSSFTRLVLFDARGWGASRTDSTGAAPSVESWADDIRLVLDDIGVEQTALLGCSAGAFFSMFFAASHPERVSKLLLLEGYARIIRDNDYPAGLPRDTLEAVTRRFVEGYGTGASLDFMAPSVASDQQTRRWWARAERLGNSPTAAGRYWLDVASRDLRSVLPALRTPTVVLHRQGDRFIHVEHGRYLARHIPAAQLVELPGDDHLFFIGDVDRLADEVELFLTGTTATQDVDRVLASVLFTDIVQSTEQLVDVGDRRWRELLDRHDTLARSYVERFRGRLIKSTGDGALAMFDGPARAIRCAWALHGAARDLRLQIRTGIHTGEIEQRGDDIGGVAVHLAARVESQAQPDEILVSRTVADLVAGSGVQFAPAGEHHLKGIPGSWQLFAVAAV